MRMPNLVVIYGDSDAAERESETLAIDATNFLSSLSATVLDMQAKMNENLTRKIQAETKVVKEGQASSK